MSLDHIVMEARAFIAEHLSSLDVATMAWLDQASTALADDASVSVLVEAWSQQAHDEPTDGDEREERFLARLSTAMAIIAKVRRRPLE